VESESCCASPCSKALSHTRGHPRDTVLAARVENKLLASFEPDLQVNEFGINTVWVKNPNETHVNFSKDFRSSSRANNSG
jgi:hypothetical protein